MRINPLFSVLLITTWFVNVTKGQAISEEIRGKLAIDKVLILTHMNIDKNSEAYADWFAYLKDFEQSNSNYQVIMLDASEANQIFETDESGFTVFLKSGFPGYVYEGLIVEPQVYSAVDEAFSKKTLSDMAKAFLPEPFEW